MTASTLRLQIFGQSQLHDIKQEALKEYKARIDQESEAIVQAFSQKIFQRVKKYLENSSANLVVKTPTNSHKKVFSYPVRFQNEQSLFWECVDEQAFLSKLRKKTFEEPIDPIEHDEHGTLESVVFTSDDEFGDYEIEPADDLADLNLLLDDIGKRTVEKLQEIFEGFKDGACKQIFEKGEFRYEVEWGSIDPALKDFSIFISMASTLGLYSSSDKGKKVSVTFWIEPTTMSIMSSFSKLFSIEDDKGLKLN